ncbi:hypothetical protein CJU89_0800 [Yarrowia sp. B02]|nr:hypothetical protein CJU89_0800 [Yarrowia sp. B02]
MSTSATPSPDYTPIEQLLALLPKLLEGNGNLATLTSLLPHGVLETVLNSPYGPALVDLLNKDVGNRPLEYSDRVLSILPIPRYAWTGTGVVQVLKMSHEVIGNNIPPWLVNMVMTTQANIFGNFPNRKDIAPSAVFVCVFCILAFGHFFVFAKGCSRKHYFWPSFGLGWHCILNTIGYGLRIGWGRDVTNIRIGIASTILIVASVVYVNAMNLLLGHRILTFRHPETGDSTWFGTAMIVNYIIIVGIIVMAIVSQVTIFIYFLDYEHWRQATGAMQAASVFAVAVASGALINITIAYTLPRGALALHHGEEDRRRLPASNIESYGIFWYPPKYSQVLQYEADPSAKLDSGKLAARVLNGRDLRTSTLIIVATTILLTVSAALRCAATFIGSRWSPNEAPIYSGTLFYIGFGVFETITNVIYLVTRIDLRFYIPDWPLKGTGPLTIKPGTMEIYRDPYSVPPAPTKPGDPKAPVSYGHYANAAGLDYNIPGMPKDGQTLPQTGVSTSLAHNMAAGIATPATPGIAQMPGYTATGLEHTTPGITPGLTLTPGGYATTPAGYTITPGAGMTTLTPGIATMSPGMASIPGMTPTFHTPGFTMPPGFAPATPAVAATPGLSRSAQGHQASHALARDLGERGPSPAVGNFQEATSLPSDSSFREPTPVKPPSPVGANAPTVGQELMGTVPPTPAQKSRGPLPAATPAPMPEVTFGDPSLASPSLHEPMSSIVAPEAPRIPEIVSFPQTPFQPERRAVTPAHFPEPILSPATPAQFPDPHISMSTYSGSVTKFPTLAEASYGTPQTERVSIPSPIHDYDPHYGRPYEEHEDEYRHSGGSEEAL